MSYEIALAEKVVSVTGGSRGVGAETMRLFVRSAARVASSYKSAQAA